MSFVFTAAAPIFGLIALGYCAARWAWLSPAAGKALAEFAFVMAVPAILFRTMITADFGQTQPTAVLTGYFGTVAVVWGIGATIGRIALVRPPEESVVFAMTASYSNLVLLGIPIALSAYGNEAAAPAAVIVSVQVAGLWLAACLHLSIVSTRAREGWLELVQTVARDFARNPIVVAILIGGAWRLTGIGLHPALDRGLTMLAQAGVPTALLAVGFTIASFRLGGEVKALVASLVLKNAVMPLIGWAIAVPLLGLPRIAATVVILFCAMPTGTATYLFATRNGIALETTSASVGLSTGMSMLTIPIVLLLLGA